MATYVSNRAAVVAKIDRVVQQRVVQAGVEYERILQEEFRSPKTGRIYGEETDIVFNVKARKGGLQRVKFVANRGKVWREGKRNAGMHRASAPGEAPAIWSGALRKGIARVVQKLGPMRFRLLIGVTKQSGRGGPAGKSSRSIAHMLEHGTTNMKERPAWRPALEKFRAGYRTASRATGQRG